MQQLIKNFPDNLLQALNIAANNPLKNNYPKFNNIVICGMGGSGIGGKLASIDKAKTILGYQPSHTLEKGLEEAVDWYWRNLRNS